MIIVKKIISSITQLNCNSVLANHNIDFININDINKNNKLRIRKHLKTGGHVEEREHDYSLPTNKQTNILWLERDTFP